jgi:hypothetical protein
MLNLGIIIKDFDSSSGNDLDKHSSNLGLSVACDIIT